MLESKLKVMNYLLEKDRYSIASKQIEATMKWLRHSRHLSDDVRSMLIAEFTALKGYIDRADKDSIPGKGRWKYRDEVEQVPIFELSTLNTPTIEPGQDATISVDIQNVGMSEGEKEVVLSINGEQQEVKIVTVAPEESKTVSFSVSDLPLGIHEINVNDLVGTLKVLHENEPVLSMNFEGEDASDQSPYKNDGTINGSSHVVEGKFGNALQLDGGWIEVPSSEFLNGGDELSIATWVKLDDAKEDQKIIGKTSIGDGYLLGVSGGMYPEIWAEGGAKLSFKEGTVPSGEWVHLTLTWKQGERLIAYINGAEVTNIAAGSNPILSNDQSLIIGGAPWDPQALQMSGAIDEVRLFKQVLQPEQIAKLMEDNTIE
ncbi:hypothetical protein FN924_14945 [Radiobacillus deserti]|uniref:LamG-like jellyroll fold domain-containing protein n=2 Tax=Radiobacillus deserti TaxID=2594883 RepID=A0A516KLF0_9BACI|nr:hypothetical protein FN924_14945 [Radiobacillus deserti]